MEFSIEDGTDRIPQAAHVAGQAFIHDPSEHTQRIWRNVDACSRADRYSRIFRLMLSLPGRNVLTAVSGDRTIGCLCYYHSRHTHLTLTQRLRLLVPFAWAAGRSFRQFLKLQALMEDLVPDEETLHLGPVAVLPGCQGHGIGSRLLKHYVAIADSDRMATFLQTGKAENLVLYERFGFHIIRQVAFEDAPVWSMVRPSSDIASA